MRPHAYLSALPTRSLTFRLTWIDVGAGTARNLEFFPIETLKRRFAKIYILDISPSLLEVARRRVEEAGLTDVVELVLADFTDLSEKGECCSCLYIVSWHEVTLCCAQHYCQHMTLACSEV